jgi:hypothetical protein
MQDLGIHAEIVDNIFLYCVSPYGTVVHLPSQAYEARGLLDILLIFRCVIPMSAHRGNIQNPTSNPPLAATTPQSRSQWHNETAPAI